MKFRRFLESMVLLSAVAAAIFTTSCGGGGSTSNPPPTSPGPLTVSLSTSIVVAPQDGTPANIGVTVSSASMASSVSVTAGNLPNGVTSQFVAAASGGPSGTLSLMATNAAPSGTYSVRARAASHAKKV